MSITAAPTVRRTATVAVGLTLALGAAAAGPASASGGHQAGAYVKPPTPFHDTGTVDAGCPNIKASIAYDSRGVDSIRRVRGTDGQAFFAEVRFRSSETWTEASTGKVLFTYRDQQHNKEVRAQRVRKADVPADSVPADGLIGPIYRFTSVEKGHDVLRDARGKVLYRDAGVVVYSELFDTLGDHAPGGTTLTYDPIEVRGPHPLLDVDLCDVAAQQAK